MSTPSDQIDTFTQKLAQHAQQSNEILFDGQWMTIEEAEQRHRQLKLDGRFKIAELVFIFTALFIAATMPFMMLGLVGGIAA